LVPNVASHSHPRWASAAGAFPVSSFRFFFLPFEVGRSMLNVGRSASFFILAFGFPRSAFLLFPFEVGRSMLNVGRSASLSARDPLDLFFDFPGHHHQRVDLLLQFFDRLAVVLFGRFMRFRCLVEGFVVEVGAVCVRFAQQRERLAAGVVGQHQGRFAAGSIFFVCGGTSLELR
jgi:hypothetical protein